MNRLLLIANRLPISITKRLGELRCTPSPGGLATGLSSLFKSFQCQMVGWPGMASGKLTAEEKAKIGKKLNSQNCMPVFLTQKQIERYYLGFSNRTIWPLFHYLPLNTVYENRFWQAYRQVNQAFCEEVVNIARPRDSIWVHDYHLMLLPDMIRQKVADVKIGFFLHIPFPSYELFRLLPWREEILHGLLGADLVGFHTYDYVQHFLTSACRILGLEHTLGSFRIGNRVVKVDAFPMGIDYEKYSEAPNNAGVVKEVRKILQKVGDCRIVISVDRLDYTKGIIQRLEAFDLFLSENPQYRGKVTLIIVAVPSRTGLEDYKIMRSKLEQLVGRVNGEHGTIGWLPVWYLYRFLPFNKLVALYTVADVALITPIRDGMNLIAKEFLAAKRNGKGVLILSEMAGAASELGEALIVNANNKAAIVKAIKDALEMPVEEQVERNRTMQERLSRYDVTKWSSDFLRALSQVRKDRQELSSYKLTETVKKKLISDYRIADSRLFLLDYDGTLVDFTTRPERAGPDNKTIKLLSSLSSDPKNQVIIISGRDKSTLDKWLGNLNVTLIAEHGVWTKRKNQNWQCEEPLRSDWKETIRPLLELYADRTPGAFVEEKDFSLVWHYRRASAELAAVRNQELKGTLLNLTANLNVGVFEGSKILEVKQLGLNKGRVAELWLKQKNWDFILAAGDDYTDEEMFDVLPEKAYSVKVGLCVSKARYNVDTVEAIRLLLKKLAGA